MVLSWRSVLEREILDIIYSGRSEDGRSCGSWRGWRSWSHRDGRRSGFEFGSAFILVTAFVSLFSAIGVAIASEEAPPSADLSVALEESVDPVIAGEVLTYALTVRNFGPDDATGVLVTERLTMPEDVTLTSSIATRGVYDQETGVWTVESLPAGGSGTLTFRLGIGSSVPSGAVISSSAKVTGDEIDPDLDNNEASEDTMIATDAHVAVVVKHIEAPEQVAGRSSYVVEITNRGPSDAQDVWFRDSLPPVELLSSARYSDDSGAAEEAWSGFMVLGDMIPKETRRILIEVDLVPGRRSSVLVPTATVSWMDTTDPICNSDSFSLSREIGSSPSPSLF